jgi:hypothetical protein
MSCNGQCVPVVSRWVRQFILTADCELAVWFKNGVCCLYPHTSKPWFDNAIAAPRPGHYVHQALYKKMAYKLIRPPCPPAGGGIATTCCTNTLPTTLHATVNLVATTVVLTWDGTFYWASPDYTTTCGDIMRFRFACAGLSALGFDFGFSCTGGSSWSSGTVPLPGAICSPLSVQFADTVPGLIGCSNCFGQTVTATVTL